MRRTWSVLLVLTVIAAGVFFCGLGSSAAFAELPLPGTEADPLVSRSYVEALMQYRVVELKPGQKIIGGAGTEIVVRVGTAKVIDSPLGGLVDATSGTDRRGGEDAPKNHLLIVPRDDGRGIRAETDVIALVRGKCSIQ